MSNSVTPFSYHKNPIDPEYLKYIPGKFFDFYLNVFNLVNNLNVSISEYYESCADLNNLFERPLSSIEECIQFESQARDIYSRGIKNIENLKISAEKLGGITEKTTRQNYYEEGLIGRDMRQIFKELYNWTKVSITSVAPSLEEIRGQQGFSQQNETYDRKILEHSTNYQEALGLFKTIYSADTKGEENSGTQERLRVLKQSLDQSFLDLVSFAGSFNSRINKINWTLLRDSFLHECDSVEFYARPNRDNFLELNNLFQTHPGEYLQKSLLYQSKLISQGQKSAAAEYAKGWMSSLPKDASWEPVESMSELFMATKEEKVPFNQVDFHEALASWLDTHPDLQFKKGEEGVLDSAVNSEGAQAIEIVRGKLCSLGGDLGFDANNHYQNCKILRPDDPIWVEMQAHFQTSMLKWAEAKKGLDKLPEASVNRIREGIAHSQYQTYSFGADLFGMGVSSYLIPWAKAMLPENETTSGALDLLNYTIQTGTNPVLKNLWVPLCGVDEPQYLQEMLARQSSIYPAVFLGTQIFTDLVLPRILDSFSKNQQDRLWYRQYCEAPLVCANGIAGLTFHGLDIGSASMPLLTGLTISCSFVNIACKADSLFGSERGPDARAMMNTAQKIANTIIPINIIYQGGGMIISGCLKRVATTIGAEVLHTSVNAMLGSLPPVGGASFLVVAGIVGVVGYRVLCDFPKARAACTMEEVRSLYSKGEYQNAKGLLTNAENWYWFLGDVDAIKQYNGCIDFLPSISSLKSDVDSRGRFNSAIVLMNKAIDNFQKCEYYSEIREDLLFHRVSAYLKINDFNGAKESLSKDEVKLVNSNSSLYYRLVLFVIKEGETLAIQDCAGAERYLTNALQMFRFNPYYNIVNEYKKYVYCRKNHPIISEDTQDVSVIKRNDSIRTLLDVCRPIKSMKSLCESLEYDKTWIHINTGEYSAADTLLSCHAQTHNQIAILIIQKGEHLCAKGDYNKALKLFGQTKKRLKAFTHKDLMGAYRNYILMRKRSPSLTFGSSEGDVVQREVAINSILESVALSDIHPSLSMAMQADRLFLYLDTKKFAKAKALLNEKPLFQGAQMQALIYIIKKAGDPQKIDEFFEYLDYLGRAYEVLDGLAHREVIKKYYEYLYCEQEEFSSEEERAEWLNSADALLAAIRPIKELAPLYIQTQFKKFFVYASARQYREAKAYFDQMDISPEIRLGLVNRLIGFLIHRGDGLDETRNLRQIAEDFGIVENEGVQKYIKVLDKLKVYSQQPIIKQHAAKPEEVQQLRNKVRAINNLDVWFERVQINYPRWIKEEKTKALFNLYISEGSYGVASIFLREAKPEIHDQLSLSTIIQSDQLCAKAEYDDADQLLEKVLSLEDFKGKSLIEKYRIYIGLCKQIPSLTSASPEEAIADREKVLNSMSPSPFVLRNSILPIRRFIKLEKLRLYLDTKKFVKAKELLTENGSFPPDNAYAAIYMIEKVKELLAQQKKQEAFRYISEACESLDGFAHREILRMYGDYLWCDQEKLASTETQVKWIGIADALLEATSSVKEFSLLHREVQCQKFLFYSMVQKYREARMLLQQMEVSEEIRLQLLNRFISFLIHRGEGIVGDGKIQQISEDFDLAENQLMKRYIKVLDDFKELSESGVDVSKLTNSIRAIDRFLQELESAQVLAPYWVEIEKIKFLVQIGALHADSDNAEGALVAYRSAEILLREQRTEEAQRLISQVGFLKKRLLERNSKVFN